MRKIIECDEMEEPVKRFLGSLDVSNEASMIEVNGRRVYLVVRPQRDPHQSEMLWNEVKDRRRHELIDLKIDSKLNPLEAVELAELEEEFDQHLNRVAPLPIESAREFLRRAQETVVQVNNVG